MHTHASRIRFEPLEPRRLLSAVAPTGIEVYMVELINRARADPAAEAARFGIDLNEGLPAGTISDDPKQPLTINQYITDAARDHSGWMLVNDVFDHTGAFGSSPGDRMESAGYVFTGSWTWGENIAWRGQTLRNPPLFQTTRQIHEDLFVDEGIDDRGHRVSMMNDSFREVGAGILGGDFTHNATVYNAVMVTTDFGRTGTGSFITGVAFEDRVIADSFYTPGEGLDAITVTATRLSDGAVFTTSTGAAGAYSLKVPAGTYTVVGSSKALGGTVTFEDVVIGSSNVKLDFRPEDAVPFDKAGNSYATARNLGRLEDGYLRRLRDFVGAPDKRDYYRFRVAESMIVKMTLSHLSENAQLILIDADGDVVKASRRKGTENERISRTVAKGTYYIKIAPARGADTNYKLTVQARLPDVVALASARADTSQSLARRQTSFDEIEALWRGDAAFSPLPLGQG